MVAGRRTAAEDIVLPDRLAGRDLPMAHVMFSRGCPFPCSFCAAGQTRIQYRSGSSARAKLAHLIDRYPTDALRAGWHVRTTRPPPPPADPGQLCLAI